MGRPTAPTRKPTPSWPPPTDEEWQWLIERLPEYLEKIDRSELLPVLSVRAEWNVLASITPQERALMFSGPMPMAEFRRRIWDRGFGGGDPLRDLAPGLERDLIGVIETGDARRKKTVLGQPGFRRPLYLFLPDSYPRPSIASV